MPRAPLALHWKVLIALALGAIIGAAVNELWTPATWASLGVTDPAAYLAFTHTDANDAAGVFAAAARFAGRAADFAGKFFLQCLRFIAVPIVLSSLVIAVAGVGDPRRIGRIGLRTLACFALTLVIAVIIAVCFASIVSPGSFLTPESRAAILDQYATEATARVSTAHQLKDQGVWAYLISIIPVNPFAAIANAQMMQVVASAFLLGLGLTLVPEDKSGPVVRFFEGLAEAVMQLVRVIMALAPYAVFCLVATFVASVGVGALQSLLAYALCVVAALALVLFVEYPLLMLFLSPRHNRMTPARFFRGMAPAMTLAFSSSSSSATLPVTIQCARDRLNVPSNIVNFVCPLGTTLNMDGTALYQVISVLFLAQLYGVDLTFADHITVAIMAAVVAVGTPGLPGASVVMMAIVLESVNVPTDGVAIILAVDRVLDMCRTIVNVSGDAVACVVVAAADRQSPPAPNPA